MRKRLANHNIVYDMDGSQCEVILYSASSCKIRKHGSGKEKHQFYETRNRNFGGGSGKKERSAICSTEQLQITQNRGLAEAVSSSGCQLRDAGSIKKKWARHEKKKAVSADWGGGGGDHLLASWIHWKKRLFHLLGLRLLKRFLVALNVALVSVSNLRFYTLYDY